MLLSVTVKVTDIARDLYVGGLMSYSGNREYYSATVDAKSSAKINVSLVVPFDLSVPWKKSWFSARKWSNRLILLFFF
jgi:hypothetical protein